MYLERILYTFKKNPWKLVLQQKGGWGCLHYVLCPGSLLLLRSSLFHGGESDNSITVLLSRLTATRMTVYI